MGHTARPTLRLASYNVHSCIGTDYCYDPERVLAVLREIDADILALQEIGDRKGPRVDRDDQFDFLRENLRMDGVFAAELVRGRDRFGNAVFVRGAIVDTQAMDLSIGSFERRNALDCLVDTDHGRLRIVATHLGLFPHERRRQIGKLADLMTRRDEPVAALMGDFNIFGPQRRMLKAIGAPQPLPRLPTFPAYRPMMSLDRIWAIPTSAVVSLRVHRTELSRVASDHLPLVGELAMPRPICLPAGDSVARGQPVAPGFAD